MTLERLTEPLAEAPANESGGEMVEGLEDIDASLVSDSQPPEATEPSKRAGTVKLAACGSGRGRVAEWDDSACLPQLRRPPVSGRDHQPRGLALLPLPAQLAHGRGDAGRSRHHRQPRERAAMGAQVWPGLRQPDPPSAAAHGRQVAFG